VYYVNRGAPAFILLLVLCSALVLLAEIGITYAGGTIYIRADGSIEGTNTIQRDGNVYTFTGDISDFLVVERDNIVVDGAGHVLEGAGTENGIFLDGRSNVTIKNITVRKFNCGIYLNSSSGNTISVNNITNNFYGILLDSFSSSNNISANNITANYGSSIYLSRSPGNTLYANNITNNGYGVFLIGSSNYNSLSGNNITANNFHGIYLDYFSNYNSIRGNNITNNGVDGIYIEYSDENSVSGNYIADNHYSGIELEGSSSNSVSENNIINNYYGIRLDYYPNNLIHHNNFVGNAEQVFSIDSVSVWDDGYPSGGNYWSDYSGVDLNSGPYQNETGSDGIGDTNYTISTDNNDRYPLMGPISTFDCGAWNNKPYYADIVSNSTISAFNFNAAQKLISFNVNGSSGTIGFCKITIDNSLLGGPYIVLVDETPVTPSVTSNGTHSFLYFTYAHSTHNVSIMGSTVIPESWIILPLLMIGTLFAVVAKKKSNCQVPQKS